MAARSPNLACGTLQRGVKCNNGIMLFDQEIPANNSNPMYHTHETTKYKITTENLVKPVLTTNINIKTGTDENNREKNMNHVDIKMDAQNNEHRQRHSTQNLSYDSAMREENKVKEGRKYMHPPLKVMMRLK